MIGTLGDDLMVGNGVNHLINGRGGDDVIINSSQGRSISILWGGSGNDILKGGSGRDQLDGGLDNDHMVGGSGADEFVMSRGQDIITDFNYWDGDTISLENFGTPYGVDKMTITEEDFGATITNDFGDQLIIYGATGSDVYKSIELVDVYEERGQIVRANFEVLA